MQWLRNIFSGKWIRNVLVALGILGVTYAQVADDPPVPPVAAQFAPHSWNEDRKDNDDGTLTAKFHVKWSNYYDGERFKPIKAKAVDRGTFFEVSEAPYNARIPKQLGDVQRFVSNNKYRPLTKEFIDEPDFGTNRNWIGHTNVTGTMSGYLIEYLGAYPALNADIVVRTHEQRIINLVRFNSEPPGDNDVQICFEMTPDSGIAKKKNGQNVKDTDEEVGKGFGFGPKSFRGVGVGDAHIWDSSERGNEQEVSIMGRFAGGKFIGCKIIPRTYLASATYPVWTDDSSTFHPDEDAESTSVDGHLSYNDAADWDTAHDATDGTFAQDSSASGVAPRVENSGGGSPFAIGKLFMLYDTSSIGAGATVTAGTVDLEPSAKLNGDNDGDDWINIFTCTPASNTSLVVGDWDQVGTTAQASNIDIGDITTGSYNQWTLTATGRGNVAVAGITKFCMREGHDAIDSAYAGGAGTANRITALFSETSGTASDPLLTITFTPAPPAEEVNEDHFYMLFRPTSLFARLYPGLL